jgi:hypothetical protein
VYTARLLAELTEINQAQRRLKAMLPQTKLRYVFVLLLIRYVQHVNRWQAALEGHQERDQRLREFFGVFGRDTEPEVYKVFMYHRCIDIFEVRIRIPLT